MGIERRLKMFVETVNGMEWPWNGGDGEKPVGDLGVIPLGRGFPFGRLIMGRLGGIVTCACAILQHKAVHQSGEKRGDLGCCYGSAPAWHGMAWNDEWVFWRPYSPAHHGLT